MAENDKGTDFVAAFLLEALAMPFFDVGTKAAFDGLYVRAGVGYLIGAISALAGLFTVVNYWPHLRTGIGDWIIVRMKPMTADPRSWFAMLLLILIWVSWPEFFKTLHQTAAPVGRELSAVEYVRIRGATRGLVDQGNIREPTPTCSIRIRYGSDNDKLASILFDAFQTGGCQIVTLDRLTTAEDVDSPQATPLPTGVTIHAVTGSVWGDRCYNMFVISTELNVHRGYRAPEAIITATPDWRTHPDMLATPTPSVPIRIDSVLIDIGPGSPWNVNSR